VKNEENKDKKKLKNEVFRLRENIKKINIFINN